MNKKSTARWLWIVLYVVLGTFACGDSSEGGGECNINGDCAAGQFCLNRACVGDSAECSESDPCATGEECVQGACVETTATGGTGTTTTGGTDTTATGGTGTATTGETSSTTGTSDTTGTTGATTGPECVEDDACGEGEICEDEECIQGCRDDEGCDGEEVCDLDVLRCVAIDPGCQADEACSEGEICEDTECIPGCRLDDECGNGGEICTNLQCVSGCRDDEGCASEEICETNLCRIGCRVDLDCGADSICVDTQCIDGCREDDDCEGSDLCVENTCTVAPCFDDDACGVGEICENTECIPGCRSDEECENSGEICTDLQCVSGCRDDEGCASDEICEADLCRIGCRVDLDCGTERFCVETQCADELPCPVDSFEPNESAGAQAHPVTSGQVTRGSICEGDRDVFRISAEPACSVRARAQFTHAEGDLALDALGLNGELIEASSSSDDVEEVQFIAQESGVYSFVVRGVANAVNTYDFEVEVICPDPCIPDAFEDNNQPDQATPITNPVQTFDATVCIEDQDFYSLSLEDGCALDVNVQFEHAFGDLKLELVDLDGNILDTSTSSSDNESISFRTLRAADLLLIVEGEGVSQNTYTMDVAIDCSLGCFDDFLEENDDIENASPTRQQGSIFGNACDEDLDVYEIPLREGCTLHADLDYSVDFGELGFSLRDAQDTVLLEGSPSEDGQSITFTNGPFGLYYLSVSLQDDRVSVNNYSLSTRVECPVLFSCPENDPYEPNNTVSVATPVESGDSLEAITCSGEPDFYTLDVFPGCQIDTYTLFNYAQGDIDTQLVDQNGVIVDAVATFDDTEVLSYITRDEGPHALRVSGWNNATNEYYVSFDVSCPEPCVEDPFEDNDSVEDATPLASDMPIQASACFLDADVFVIEAERGCTLDVDVLFRHDEGDVDITLRNDRGEVVSESVGDVDNESVSTRVPVSGAYYVTVYLDEGEYSNVYTLNARLTDCPDPNDRPQLALSEVMFNAPSGDDGREWVEITNLGNATAVLSEYSLGYGGIDYTYGTYALDGLLEPGECIVVGGPISTPDIGDPVYNLSQDFSPDLQNGGTLSDGLALFDVPAGAIEADTIPIDAVIYDSPNLNNLMDETGEPSIPDIGEVDGNQGDSIERTSQGWRFQSSPSPGVCRVLE